jgi:hypothetical protein
MAPIESYATDEGLVFDSRSKYLAHLAEHGMTVKEKGMFSQLPKPPAERITFDEIREEAEKAFYDLKYDRVPMTEKEKELCRREQRNFEEYKKRRG